MKSSAFSSNTLAFDPDFSTHGFDEAVRNIEPQTRTRCRATPIPLQAYKTLEDARLILRRDAFAPVSHADDDSGMGIGGNLRSKCYGRRWRRVFEGVYADIEKHPAQSSWVGSYVKVRWNVEIDLSLFLCYTRFKQVKDTLYHLLDRD